MGNFRQCKAHNRKGQQCKLPAVEGKEVCRLHGGLTPSGIAHPAFKHGRYSKALPARLIERYEASIGDKELLNLTAEIAVIDARLGELLGRADTGEAGEWWRKAGSAFGDLDAAMSTGDVEGVQRARIALRGILHAGQSDYAAWNEIASLMEQRRRLVESERKRLVDMQQMVTAHEAMTLVQALLESIKANVPDKRALANIQSDFVRITAGRNS